MYFIPMYLMQRLREPVAFFSVQLLKTSVLYFLYINLQRLLCQYSDSKTFVSMYYSTLNLHGVFLPQLKLSSWTDGYGSLYITGIVMEIWECCKLAALIISLCRRLKSNFENSMAGTRDAAVKRETVLVQAIFPCTYCSAILHSDAAIGWL